MDLIVTEVKEGIPLRQRIKATDNQFISVIRPWIYIQGAPGGDIRLEVFDALDTTLIATSNEVSVATIKTAFDASDNFTHGVFRFDIEFGAVRDVEYWIRMNGVNGYTFGSSDFAAWNKDFDLKIYDADFAPSNGGSSAFLMEIWETKDIIKGVT